MPPEEIYSKLSRIYNTVMHKVRYDRWSEYLLAVVELYMNEKAEVLEIAGGNCNFAGYFIEHFPKLIVTDKSFNMLASSKFKNIPRICCDMIKLPFKSKFDLIYSTFDSVNYLTSRKSLLNLFKGLGGSLLTTPNHCLWFCVLSVKSIANCSSLASKGTLTNFSP